MRRTVTSIAMLVAFVLLAAPTARAQAVVDQDVLERAASALRQDAVYVDPDAERAISPGAADQFEAAVGGGETPIFIAILPASVAAEAGGDPGAVPGALAQARPGRHLCRGGL